MAYRQAQLRQNDDKGQLRPMTMTRNEFAAYEYLCRQTEARKWIEAVTSEKLTESDFHKALMDGVFLCKVGNLMYPDSLKRWNGPSSPRYKMIENIELFLACMEQNGIPKADLFDPIDLYEKKNMPKVVNTLFKFADSAKKKGFQIIWDQQKQLEFTPQEIQAAIKLEGVALWNKSSTSSNVSQDEQKKREDSKLKKEREEKEARETFARLQAESELQKKKAEEEARKAEEERRKQQEEEDRKKREAAEEEARRRKAEEDAIAKAIAQKSKDLEDQLRRKQSEEEKKRKQAQEEEALRKKILHDQEELLIEKKIRRKS